MIYWIILCVYVQEFLAHGFTNIVGSFFSCFVSSGSLSRSVIQDVTGGNTQVYIYTYYKHLKVTTVGGKGA